MADGIKRKISAILSADVAGYSKLMEADEESTVRTMESYRKTVISLIGQHNGRVIDSPGDNILSEFGSVVDAVQCAVEAQHVIKAKNAGLPEARRMEFRIGINLGDVIEEDNRTYGDGVNIAARIEKIADAGGICISESAYQQIKSKLLLGYEDLGEHSVKNITEPFHVYRIPLEGRSIGGIDSGKSTEAKKWRMIAVAAIVVIVVAVGMVEYRSHISMVKAPYKPEKETISAKKAEPSLIEKPSIAVLPFVNMSDDPTQEYFSDGISEDILNGLAGNPNLSVIARTSSFQFKGKNQDVRKIGKQLNATHLLEGSVRKSNGEIRVTAQLVNTDKGTHIWSEQYDRELTYVFDIQDEIASQILSALKVHLLASDKKHLRTANIEAYKAYLQGRYQFSSGLFSKAATYFKRAISLDPSYSNGYAWLTIADMANVDWGFVTLQEVLPRIVSNIEKALTLNPDQVDALGSRTRIAFYVDRSYQNAINKCNELLQRAPNNAEIPLVYTTFLSAVGQFDASLKVADKVLEIDPLNHTNHMTRGIILTFLGRFDEAQQSFEASTHLGMIQAANLAWIATLNKDLEALMAQLDLGVSAG